MLVENGWKLTVSTFANLVKEATKDPGIIKDIFKIETEDEQD